MSPDWPIETERLTLRPFREDDFEAFFAIYGDDEVVRYLYNDARDEAETRVHLQRKIDSPAWRKEGDWLGAAVIERESGLLVGDVALFWLSEAHRTAEIGFVFNRTYHGRGFATEAARPLLAWAFEDAGMHRVIGRTEARNAASARVLSKLGMRQEAHLVENEWVKGEWQSELMFAVLEREWR